MITNNTTTPGPPSKMAAPRLLKLPAPSIAAIPKNVRSLRVNTLFRPSPPCAPSLPSAIMLDISFRLNNDDISLGFDCFGYKWIMVDGSWFMVHG